MIGFVQNTIVVAFNSANNDRTRGGSLGFPTEFHFIE
jgi:hypothetical protein